MKVTVGDREKFVVCVSDVPPLTPVLVPKPDPSNNVVYTAQWYCQETDCDVREIDVRLKHYDGPPKNTPPLMKCPSCGQPAKFHGYLEPFRNAREYAGALSELMRMHREYHRP